MPLPLIVAGGAKLLSIGFGLKANKQKKRAAKSRAALGKIQNLQAKREFVNKFFDAQGTALARGAVSGVELGSSGIQGTQASNLSSANARLFEQDVKQGFAEDAGRADAKASKLEGLAAGASAISSIASTFS